MTSSDRRKQYFGPKSKRDAGTELVPAVEIPETGSPMQCVRPLRLRAEAPIGGLWTVFWYLAVIQQNPPA